MKSISHTDKEFTCDISLPCFAALSPEEAGLVRESRVQVVFHRGENLAKQGAFASYLVFIAEGYTRQFIEGSNGRIHNLRIIGPGELVGLSSVFNPNTFSYSVVAITETTGFLLEKEAVTALIKQNGEFAFGMIRRYCEQNIRLYSSLDLILNRQANGRIASVLLTLAPERFNGQDLFRHLTRKDLADFAGISTERAVKVLKSFEKDSLVRLSEKSIILLNHARLEEISRTG